MKLLVALDVVPFVPDGVELLAGRLVVELCRAGHEAELLRLPAGSMQTQLLEGVVAAAMLHVVNVDRVVALSFPASIVPHPDVVVWLVHATERTSDVGVSSWAGAMSDPADGAMNGVWRASLAAANRVYAALPDVAERLRADDGVTAAVLPVPASTDSHDRPDATRDATSGGQLESSHLAEEWDRVVNELTR